MKYQNGKMGEILITGKSVADGYVTESNNKSFFEYKGKKAYLTGDLGYLKEEILYYECRKDKQIKFKGYRIELSDIEKNLYDLGYIEKTVITTKNSSDNKVIRIIAFVKLKLNVIKNEVDIKKELKKRIPEYMCPSIKIVNEIPLTTNGKCDAKKLLEEF